MNLRRLLSIGSRHMWARVSMLLGCGMLFVLPCSIVSAQQLPQDYLQKYLDLKEKAGTATAQNEGALEVTGVIQGKIRSDKLITWLIRDDANGDGATYQFRSEVDYPEFDTGRRVRALGKGLDSSSTPLVLMAIIADAQPAAAPAPAPAAPAKSQTHTRILNYAAPLAAAAKAAKPAARAAAKATSKPINKAQPPKWREPAGSRASQAEARPQNLSSRGWGDYIARYMGAIRWFNPGMSSKQAETIARSILAFGMHYHIDPRLVVAIIAVESGFHTSATSNKGAMGLGQLMPGTAAGLGVRDAYDPVENIWGAVKLLRGHMKEHAGKPFWEQLALALASYNAGSGAVRKYGGVPPYRETQNYVRKVAGLYKRLCGYR